MLKIFVDKNPVQGFELNVFALVAAQGFAQINGKYVQCAVGSAAKQLHLRQQGVRRDSARKINRVTQTRAAIGQVISGMAHLAAHRNHRRLFKIKAAEYPYRVERFQFQWRFPRHDLGKVKGQHRGSVIGRAEANEFSMARGFREQFVVGRNQIS